MASVRLERLQALIQRDVAEIISYRLRDPRLRLGSIVEVKLARDLSVATVKVSCLGSEADKRTFMRALHSARGRIRSLIGQGLRIRALPELRFVYDERIERSVRIAQVIARALEEDRAAQRARGELPPAEVTDTDEDAGAPPPGPGPAPGTAGTEADQAAPAFPPRAGGQPNAGPPRRGGGAAP